jgi:hypothetical protein
MRRGLAVAGFALASFIGFVPVCAAMDTPIAELKTSLVVLTAPAKPNFSDARLLGDTIVHLRQRSATFRDLLAVLGASPRLLALFAPSTEINYVNGFIGRTRFRLGPTRTVAFVDVYVDRLNLALLREAVAHEMAHIAEVACFGDVASSEELRALLLRQPRRRASRSSAVFETGFAQKVGRAVVREAAARAASPSQFQKFTREFHLSACPTIPLADGFTVAGGIDVQSDRVAEPYR